jgi:hypothetical protein
MKKTTLPAFADKKTNTPVKKSPPSPVGSKKAAAPVKNLSAGLIQDLQQARRLPARKYFRFHHQHPLHELHAQVLRSKQNTLIINGHAPKYPGTRPLLDEDCERTDYNLHEYHQALKGWTKDGIKFAEFYIASFMTPHDCFNGNSFPDSTCLVFESLSERIEQMEKCPHLIDRMRVEAMTTYICGFRTDSTKHKLLETLGTYVPQDGLMLSVGNQTASTETWV